MAFYIDWAEKLQATRNWLQNTAQPMDPRNYMQLTGMLNYLQSPSTPKVIQEIQKMNANAGEYKDVQIRYIPHKGTGNLITSDASGTCTKVNQRRDYLDTVRPTLYAEDKFTIEENYVRDNSEGSEGKLQARLNAEIRDAMRVCRESMDAQLFAKAATVVGANPAQGVGAGSYHDLTVIIDASGKIDDRYFDVLKNDQEDNLMPTGDIDIVGLGNARRYLNRLAVGNANDAGIDYRLVAQEFGMRLWKDSYTTSTLSDANRVLAFYPGSAQMFNYNLYASGDFTPQIGDVAIKGTLTDPIFPGIQYDYQLRYDDNCSTGTGQQGAWVGRLWTYFDLWTIPEDAFGDVYNGLNDFNGIIGYRMLSS
jgi:hypothetical protein